MVHVPSFGPQVFLYQLMRFQDPVGQSAGTNAQKLKTKDGSSLSFRDLESSGSLITFMFMRDPEKKRE